MKKRLTIGVLIGNANSPHTMELMEGIYQGAEKMNVNILFFLGIHSGYYYRSYFGTESWEDFDYQFNVVYDYARLGKLDALIVSYGSLCIFLKNNDKTAFLEQFQGIPYVLLEDFDETGNGSSIISDNYNGIYKIVEHLVRDHHYTNFSFLAGPEGNTDADMRKQAFFDALKKYQIPFDESRLEYGDFSPCVEQQVQRLLDKEPLTDAIVCANDVMADTVYKECGRRGLIVGRDIAVTGYDDWEAARSMNPPLTTVLQNAYDMGYMSVIGATELCRGRKPHSVVVPAQIKFRGSCGCLSRRTIKTLSTSDSCKRFLHTIAKAGLDENTGTAISQKAHELFEIDFTARENHSLILSYVLNFLHNTEGANISVYSVSTAFNDYIDSLLQTAAERSDSQKILPELLKLKNRIQDMVMAQISKDGIDKYNTFQQETWFVPLISRDMMNHISNTAEFYSKAMTKLCALGAKSSYLFIFKEPIKHLETEDWICPDEMYLAACHTGTEIHVIPPEKQPLLRADNGLLSFCSDRQAFSMSVFCLFSGEMQYGILVTEIRPSSLALSYLISMQIGNALKYHNLYLKQMETQKTLEKLLTELNEKNEILNFISEYDTLSNCLNRRGFLEKASQLTKENLHKNAVIVFADIDHLKEINDSFGHNEGDFAIHQAGKIMLDAVGSKGIVGRIGGDEFVALLLDKGCETEKHICQTVKDKNSAFNAVSDKPYYIEMSMGYHKFTCRDGLILPELLEKADRALYSEKKKRKPSIKKNVL